MPSISRDSREVSSSVLYGHLAAIDNLLIWAKEYGYPLPLTVTAEAENAYEFLRDLLL